MRLQLAALTCDALGGCPEELTLQYHRHALTRPAWSVQVVVSFRTKYMRIVHVMLQHCTCSLTSRFLCTSHLEPHKQDLGREASEGESCACAW